MSGDRRTGAGGCAIILVVFVIGLLVMALISIAALVDPFSWMPSVHQIWADCEDKFETAKDECALANRFHGFWEHAIANLAWTVAAGAAAVFTFARASHIRRARRERFDSMQAVERYRVARRALASPALVLFLLAAAPIVVAAAR